MEAVNLLPLHARPGRRWATVGRDAQPRRVRLQTLSMQSPTPFVVGAATPATAPATPPASTPAPQAGGAPFTVSGVATSHVRVALVLDRLAALPWLSNVQLVSSTSGASLSAGDTFSVNAGFNPGGGQ